MFADIAFSWCQKKQAIMALFSCNAKYLVSCSITCEVVWLQNVLDQMDMKYNDPLSLHIYNKSTISLLKT